MKRKVMEEQGSTSGREEERRQRKKNSRKADSQGSSSIKSGVGVPSRNTLKRKLFSAYEDEESLSLECASKKHCPSPPESPFESSSNSNSRAEQMNPRQMNQETLRIFLEKTASNKIADPKKSYEALRKDFNGYDRVDLRMIYLEQFELYQLFIKLTKGYPTVFCFDSVSKLLIATPDSSWSNENYFNTEKEMDFLAPKLRGVALKNTDLWASNFDKSNWVPRKVKYIYVEAFLYGHNFEVYFPEAGKERKKRTAKMSCQPSRSCSSECSSRGGSEFFSFKILHVKAMKKAFKKLSSRFKGMPQHIFAHIKHKISGSDSDLLAFGEAILDDDELLKGELPPSMRRDFEEWRGQGDRAPEIGVDLYHQSQTPDIDVVRETQLE